MGKSIKGERDVWTKSDATWIGFAVSGWLETTEPVKLKGSFVCLNNTGDARVELCFRTADDPNDPSTWGSWTQLGSGYLTADGSFWAAAYESMTNAIDGKRAFQLGIRAKNVTTSNTATEMCNVTYMFDFRSA